MSGVKDHGYTWGDVRQRPADELTPGDTWVNPGTGTAYCADKDGRRIIARSQTGATLAGEFPAGHVVLKVVEPEPVGTVLVVGSHRARERLERALGRKPAGYWTLKRGGKFVVLYGGDVATALGITSITRTRLKPEDVGLCIGDDMYARRDADRRGGVQGVPGFPGMPRLRARDHADAACREDECGCGDTAGGRSDG